MINIISALPQPVMTQWYDLCGQVLLERYGMTEIGMALSNSYLPVNRRLPGHVGKPLPFVEVRIVSGDADKGESEVEIHRMSGDDLWHKVPEPSSHAVSETASAFGTKDAHAADEESDSAAGELRVRGPAVFKEYLNKAQFTKESFDNDGWFKTGDVVVFNKKEQAYRILGRASSDVIKSAGYKLSSLEIEREILSYPPVKDCAVVGVPDEALGQALVAVICLNRASGRSDDEETASLAEFLSARLARYKRNFKKVVFVNALPRNAMGKVNKKNLLNDLGIAA